MGPESDQPDTWLDSPPTPRQRWYAGALVALLIVGFAVIVPVSGTPLAQMNALFPSLDAIVFVVDLITAILLFAQFSISRSRALLALATGYFFTAVIVVPHALTIAGAFTPTGLLGANIQTGSWLFIFWHIGFSAALLAYAVLSAEKFAKPVSELAALPAIGWSMAGVFAAVAGLTWLATEGATLLPAIILDKTRMSPIVVYPIWFTILLSAGAIAVLLVNRRRSILDLWLMVVALVSIGELAFSGLLPSIRFSAGFYAGRVFSLITSSIVLIVMLAETTRLYVRVAHSNATLRRERDNRLMNLEAVAASISHEVRQPLGAVVMNSEAALVYLKKMPISLEKVQLLLTDVVAESHRASQILQSIRTLFGRTDGKTELIHMNDLAVGTLRALRTNLTENDVAMRMQLASDLPPFMGDKGQMQEVIINLVHNAIEAMASVKNDGRMLTVRTYCQGGDAIVLEVEDSGPGIDPSTSKNIFDPFVTTKPQGTGLGLAICQMIVERHKGRISVAPARPRGAMFHVVLPGRRVEGRQANE